MKVRIQFQPLGDESLTVIHDSTSMTQPDMSLSIKQIVEKFAFLGDLPMGMLEVAPPEIKEDEALFEAVDVERLDIAELEDLSIRLRERAEYLRGLPPSRDASNMPARPDVPDVEKTEGDLTATK